MKKIELTTGLDSGPQSNDKMLPKALNTRNTNSPRLENPSKMYESVINEESINLKIIESKENTDIYPESLIKKKGDASKPIKHRGRSETLSHEKLYSKVRDLKMNLEGILLNYSPRRYNKANIEKGKNFFKMRYILEKFQDLWNIKIDDKESHSNVNTKTEKSLHEETSNNLEKKINFQNLSGILNEDKNAIKFNSLYLQKLDKGIFSFNIKKYEDSYNYLKNSGIIKNEIEFGELLLVITGFDKYIIGDFLSKEKFPNKEKKVLLGYMKSFNFREVNFLEALRFLLSRLNLPKDASLMLEIIDVFSTQFYEDNKDKFKDANSIYLLSSSVLTLNTIFSRPDIQNINALKKEDFIKMNKDIQPSILEGIYDDLKQNKMDITYDYSEVVYRRLSFESNNFFSSEEAFNKRAPNEMIQEKQQIETNGDELIEIMKKGETFTKYGKYGEPHPRVVKLSGDEKKIEWLTLGSCRLFKKSKCIEVEDIKDIYIGVSSSRNFEKFKISPNYDPNCFSVLCSKRSLDLRQNDESICKKWFHGIKFLIKRTKSIAELKNKENLKDTINKKEIVSDIWKTEILPHWHLYRKFVISKKGNERLSNKEVNKKYKEKFAKIIGFFKPSNKGAVPEKILEDKSEFIYLWTLGVPDWLRKKVWALVIGNESGVSENLFNFHLKEVEPINFEELSKINFKHKETNTESINFYKTVSQHVEQPKIHLSDDPILNEIAKDILKVSQKFSFEIKNENLNYENFINDLYKVVRAFTIFRPDITYSKQITYISAILLINSENFYSAFVSLIRTRLEFFEQLLKTYVPTVHKHFNKMDVTSSLYFFDWFDHLFIKTFKYETLLRIWDIYLIKGEVFLYEVALAIIKIQEKNLVRFTIKDVLKNLKKISINVNEDEFFDTLQEIDISEEYKTLMYESNLAREKGLLFQSFMIEWI